MTSEPLVVETVRFVATEECMADPSLFQAVRDFVARDRKDKGLTAQYWGPSVERPKDYYWYLLWQTRAHADAFEEDPSYPVFVQQRQALATAPMLAIFVPMHQDPQRCLEAPVTELDLYKLQTADADKTHDLIARYAHRIESMSLPGFVALSWGTSLEDSSRGGYLAGWGTVEDHMRMGTVEEHKVLVQEIEPIYAGVVELYVAHVHFKLHETK